ncbi:hypothetical protein ACFOLG_02050 [Vogesella facilis]|uniref:Uncharacterized protein n=1 Tax=Vogesella facilis TaxID=1655232 RepID=A0ABV7RCM4_9NEIS
MKTPLWPFFPFGFVLSAPLLATLAFGFSGHSMSNEANNICLLIMLVIGLLSLPGSLVLLVVGFVAAFSGKQGEILALVSMALAVANAHFMAMVYARALSPGTSGSTDDPAG